MSLFQDVRYAVRMIRKRPTVSAIVVLTLGLGIGANGIFFAIFYGSALRPLPFESPDRLVALHALQPTLGETRVNVSAPDYRDWTEDNPVFAGAGAYTWQDYNFQSADEPDRIEGCSVTAGLFPLLGVDPLLGRHFLPEEDRPGGPLVALISHAVWTERFASDPRIVGRTVRLDGEVREIVGVMPKGFRFSHYGELWTPLQLDVDATPRESRQVAVIARLRDGTGLAEAQEAMTAVAEHLAALYPDTNAGWTVDVHVLREAWMPATAAGKLAMAAQLVLVACVLLIVCVNVTNVVLAQATVRQQERALRAALGASRGRLIRQILVESTVLAMGGGVLGALLASWTDVWFKSVITVPFPYWLHFGLERHGLVYVLVVTLAAGIVIGLLPAIRSSGRFLFDALRSGGGVEESGSSWLRRGLVVGEYAMALVILVPGLLMVKSFDNLRREDRGFATENILTLKLPLTAAAYDEGPARAAFLRRALRRLGGLAETTAVGAVNQLPLHLEVGGGTTALGAEGLSFPEGEEPRVLHQAVSADYFEALSMPRLAGRTFTDAEVSDGADAVLVSASLAALLWPGEEAIHRRVRTVESEPGPWLEVVGVVGDVEPAEMLPGFGASTRHRIYLPLAGTASPSPVAATPRTPALVLASRVEPAALVPAVRRELAAVDASVPLFEVLSMEDVLDRFYFARQAWSRTFSAMALLALVIAAVGVYGVTSYSVSRRTREMGIRIAMGASPRRLLAQVVRQGLVLAAVGVGLGVAAAVPLSRAMQMLLHDVRAVDPGVFTTVVAVLLGVGFLASWGPARRAASADPIVALRDE
jgi:putative ABC transport system permease protein